MRRAQGQALTRHFFRAFFQTDNAASEEAGQTPVVRALAVVATPMLMAAFWIVTLAHGLHPWGAAGIHYLFALYAFCAMGCIATAQWERLFPERMDFLILLPLPLRGGTMFTAKLRAVGLFLGMFLVAANVFGALLLPVLAGRHLPQAMLAHAVAVFTAGAVATLAVLAMQSLVIVVTPERWFGRVAPAVQTLLIALFLLLFLQIATVSERLPLLLRGGVPEMRWFAPLWFTALYEVLLGGETATPFAHGLMRDGLLSLPVLMAAVAVLYPLAWVRRRRMALEGVQSARLRDGRVWAMVHRVVLRDAWDRAVFHFARQTLTRLGRYHVLLSAYCGVGLALSVAFALRLDDAMHARLWRTGAQAAMPLLLFWTVAGLRVAFLMPADLAARWVFRMAPLHTVRVIQTAKQLVFACCCGTVAFVVAALAACRWGLADLVLQALFGLVFAVLLVDLFFYLESSVPFTRPRTPGQSNLPMTLAVFVFGVPVFVLLAVTMERWVAHIAWHAAVVCVSAAAVHGTMHWLRRLPSHPASDDAFLGEKDTDVQTLGLSV